MKGIYCLIIDVKKDIRVKIGARGEMLFEKGCYAYLGSAQNNLGKRLARHLTRDKPLRWHIDYLLAADGVRPVRVYIREAPREEECRMADEFSRNRTPVPGFGCSDCNCGSHLFRLGTRYPAQPDGMRKLDIRQLKK